MVTGFITLDIDVWSNADLDPLIAGLEGVAFVVVDDATRTDDGSRRFVTFELESESVENAEQAITTFLDALASAPPTARAAWDASSRRHLNIGVNAPREGSSHVVLSPAVLRAVAAADASVEITVYPPELDEDPRRE